LARFCPRVDISPCRDHKYLNADADSVLKTLRSGAAGYLVKTADPAELELAIRAVARGERFLSSAVSEHVVSASLISVKTAEAYRSELMKALDIHDIASLTRYAIREGLVSLDR
jgi:DNA-binding NarL/FixJ family response regulator